MMELKSLNWAMSKDVEQYYADTLADLMAQESWPLTCLQQWETLKNTRLIDKRYIFNILDFKFVSESLSLCCYSRYMYTQLHADWSML